MNELVDIESEAGEMPDVKINCDFSKRVDACEGEVDVNNFVLRTAATKDEEKAILKRFEKLGRTNPLKPYMPTDMAEFRDVYKTWQKMLDMERKSDALKKLPPTEKILNCYVNINSSTGLTGGEVMDAFKYSFKEVLERLPSNITPVFIPVHEKTGITRVELINL